MRIWIGGLVHETSSFSLIPTRVADFSIERPRGASSASAIPYSAYVDTIAAAHSSLLEVVPGWFGAAQPSAPLEHGDYMALRTELLEDLAAALPVDIVALVLHGAQSSSECDDCEGDLLDAVQTLVAPDVPIGALLDLHTNLTPRMLSTASILIACKEYPHIDYAARAEELIRLLIATRTGRIRPVMHAARVPTFGAFPTRKPPFDAFVRRLAQAERQERILSTSALHGFLGTDNPFAAGSVIVVADADPEAAQAAALELADDFLRTIRDYGICRTTVADALGQFALETAYPVVLADRSDNPGGGAASDSTHVLREILARGITDVALGMIWDASTVVQAHAAGVGATLRVSIGGKAGPLSGDPAEVDVVVSALRTDAAQAMFAQGPPDQPLGLSAALRIGTVDVVVNTIRQQVFDPRCFSEHGIDILRKRLVVVKSTEHFRAGFEPVAAKILSCDAPGTLSSDPRDLPYRRLCRPLWPFDTEVSCEPMNAEPCADGQMRERST